MQFASYFLQAVQGIRSTLIYRPGVGWPVTAPGAHSMATCRGGTRKWPWLRMHVLYRNGCPLFRPVSSLAGDPGRLDLGKPASVQLLESDRADRALSDPGTERIARHQATPQDLLPYELAGSVH